MRTFREYRALRRLDRLQAGDLLIKQVFLEDRFNLVEGAIVLAQIADFKDLSIHANQNYHHAVTGSATSEHAAIAIDNYQIAEAIGSGIEKLPLSERLRERYIVYRCTEELAIRHAVEIAARLQNRQGTTGGKYNLGGAFSSNRLWPIAIGGERMRGYYNQIVDYCFGAGTVRPNMFCSEFVAACYELGFILARNAPAFNLDPRALGPMRLESALIHSQGLFVQVGRYQVEGESPLNLAVSKALRTYAGKFKFNQSVQSKYAVKTLEMLVSIGDEQWLRETVCGFLNVNAVGHPPRQEGVVSAASRLKTDSSLYKILKEELRWHHIIPRA